jgi:hypothetical protein
MDSEALKVVGKVALVAFFIVMFGMVGSMDYEDAKASEMAYEERVCQQVHGDYLDLDVRCGA